MPSENTHDPLCTEFNRSYCVCSLIARVVERERKAARERVLALGCGNSDCEACLIRVYVAADAAGGAE